MTSRGTRCIVAAAVTSVVAGFGLAATTPAQTLAAVLPPVVVRSVSPSDVGPWDPATTSAPATRWFVLPGDQQGNGAWTFLATSTPAPGVSVGPAIQLSAPSSGDRVAIATLAPPESSVVNVKEVSFDVWDGAGTVFLDADCNGTASGGIVRARAVPVSGSQGGFQPGQWLIVDRNVYADGSTGSGSGAPVLVAGDKYGLGSVANACPSLRDYGFEVADGQSALFTKATYDAYHATTTRRDYFRTEAPGTKTPVRLGGADRIATALAAAKVLEHPSTGWRAVVLGRSDEYADDLAGAVLARRWQSPLLLTHSTSLDKRVSDYLKRSMKPGGTVYILGGIGALSGHVFNQVKALGLHPDRLGGANRYATAVAIAQEVQPTFDCSLTGSCGATIADGTNFPDALSASNLDPPILYSAHGTLPAATLGYLRAIQPPGTLIAVGGPAANALAASAYKKYTAATYVGADRYATSAKVLAAQALPSEADLHVAVATGLKFPDALVGATVGDVVLTRPDQLPDSVAAVLGQEAPAIGTVYLMGTADVVSDAVSAQVQQAMMGHDVTTWPS